MINTSIEAKCLNQEIVLILSKICELSSFIYGEAWIPIPEENILELSSNYYIYPSSENQENVAEIYHSKSDHLISVEQFWLCSQEFVISEGEGLPGRVWSSKKPEWILDVTAKSEDYFLRNKIAKAFGIKSGFALPVISNKKVLMVLAFFDLHTNPINTEQVKLFMKETEKLANILSP